MHEYEFHCLGVLVDGRRFCICGQAVAENAFDLISIIERKIRNEVEDYDRVWNYMIDEIR